MNPGAEIKVFVASPGGSGFAPRRVGEAHSLIVRGNFVLGSNRKEALGTIVAEVGQECEGGVIGRRVGFSFGQGSGKIQVAPRRKV